MSGLRAHMNPLLGELSRTTTKKRQAVAFALTHWTPGFVSAMDAFVTKQVTTVALLCLALFSAASHTSAQRCAMTMPARTMDCSADCCAKMKSCVLPQQNPVQPSATAEAVQRSFVMIAPILNEGVVA